VAAYCKTLLLTRHGPLRALSMSLLRLQWPSEKRIDVCCLKLPATACTRCSDKACTLPSVLCHTQHHCSTVTYFTVIKRSSSSGRVLKVSYVERKCALSHSCFNNTVRLISDAVLAATHVSSHLGRCQYYIYASRGAEAYKVSAVAFMNSSSIDW
jgi:hypothetical protein